MAREASSLNESSRPLETFFGAEFTPTLTLPRAESSLRSAHFSALLDVKNASRDELRLELLSPSGVDWVTVLPSLPPDSNWARGRQTPLYLPRVKAVRLVRCSDGVEVWRKAPWGEGGAISVA